jgi:NAD(P)-dependent dehydrogenase (short-subunit alcohol dehydrogenase family)
MKTIIITGGTDGIGRGLALHLLGEGHRVIAVGSSPDKGERLLRDSGTLDAGGRATFIQADLSSMRDCRRLIADLADSCPALDALILCARRDKPFGLREETPDGFERHLALLYLSRFALARGLAENLARSTSPRPVILNVCTPGTPGGSISWDDLQLQHRYRGIRAVLQALRANDLLGPAFAGAHPRTPARFIAYNPGVVRTGMADQMPQPARTLMKTSLAIAGKPVARALPPMLALLGDPPQQAFTAWSGAKPVDTSRAAFHPASAARLYEITASLLANAQEARP